MVLRLKIIRVKIGTKKKWEGTSPTSKPKTKLIVPDSKSKLNIFWPQLNSVMMSLTAEKGRVISAMVDMQLKVAGDYHGQQTGTAQPSLTHNQYSHRARHAFKEINCKC